MQPIALRLSWRSWWRVVTSALVSVAAGVVALADTVWFVRLLAAVVFAALLVAVVDAVVFVRSWDVDGRRWWVPSLLSRGRIIPVDDQRVVELRSTYPARLRISGSRGQRDLLLNPLVSLGDLDRWFDEIAA